jgi:16S rRNA (adenine1518-N6/adenine1519-N6)-dimethyltransferase
VTNPRELLEAYAIDPKKSLGQNFIHDPNMLDKIVAAAELSSEDAALEIGPGTGAMTERLAGAARRVVAVELDNRLEPILEETLAPYSNVELLFQDILTVDVPALFEPDPYVVVANVPYYITSAILRHLLENRHRPRRLVLTMQYEVAERLVAKPDDMSILAVSTQFYGSPKIVARLKPAVFWPRPDVDSAVIRMDTFAAPPVDVPDEKTFFQVVRAGFGQKRKQLKNSLSAGLHLNSEAADALFRAASIDPRRRAETLTLDEWARLTRAYAEQR